jgi:hypothetical protein
MRQSLARALALIVAMCPTATVAQLTVNLSGVPRQPQAGTGLHITGADNTIPRIVVEGFGVTDPIVTMQAGAGTAASPSPPSLHSLLGSVNFRGWDGTVSPRNGFSFGAVQLRAWAAEPWGASNHGAFATLSTTPLGTGSTGANDLTRQTWWADGAVSLNAYSQGNLRVEAEGMLVSSPSVRASAGGFIGLGPVADYTIVAGAITVAGTRVRVDTEAGAASDDLSQVNGCVSDGDLVIVQAASAARPVTARDQWGNLQLAGDFVLANPSYRLTLACQISNGALIEISRSNNG